jgi:hypothetical protein
MEKAHAYKVISTVGSPSLNAKKAEGDLLSQFIMGPRVKKELDLLKLLC